MVGYLTSTQTPNQSEEEPKKAFLEFPVLKSEHLDAHDLVISKAFETLRKKGIKVVSTRASEDWSPTLDWVKKYGYIKDRPIFKVAEFDINSLNTQKLEKPQGLFNLNWDTDETEVNQFIQDFYSISEERANGAISQLKRLGDNVLTHQLLKVNGKIQGRLMTYRNPANSDEIYFTTPMTRGDNQEIARERLLRSAIETLKTMDNVNNGFIFLNGPAVENEQQFESLNIKFKEGLAFYEKEL